MAETKYTYTISTDFPSAKVHGAKLKIEIEATDIVTALDRIDTLGDACDIWFKDALSAGDQTTLDGVVAAHDGEPVVPQADPKSPSGVPLVEPHPREGSSLVIVTHNWCDKCTWYTQSTRVDPAEELTDSGDGLTFNSAHANWIDLTHGRMYGEDKIASSYLPVVKIDGVVATERAPFADSGGDFTINYVTGAVTFFSSQTGNTITAEYSYAGGSNFIIAPTTGKALRIEKSEVQFSTDIDIKDTIRFQPWVYNPADLPNKVPYGDPTVYKHIRDFIDEAEGVYPKVPAIGGSSGRGLSQEHCVFPFNYKTMKVLNDSQGAEISVSLDSDLVFGGEFATATFYCTSKDE